SEQSRAPEGEAGALVFAVHFFQAGTHDRAAEHQLGQEELARKGAELACRMVIGDAIDRTGPAVGYPYGRLAARFGRMLPLGWVGKAVEPPLHQMAELVGGDPLALVVGEKDLAAWTGAPTQRVAETEGDLLRLLPGDQP